MELVEKNILPVESSLKEAIIGKVRGGSLWRAFPHVAVITYQFTCMSKRVQSHGWSCFPGPESQAFSPRIWKSRSPSGPDNAMETLNYRECGHSRII